MYYYHMTTLNNLYSIAKQGLIPKNENNGKLIGEEKVKVFFYLRFDGTEIKNERNFENGCTDMTISPEKLSVCILRRECDNSIIFSRFEIIKYMMAKIQPEQIKYYGAIYEGSPNFTEATSRIQEKVKKYYKDHQTEITEYGNCDYILDFIELKDFVDKFL